MLDQRFGANPDQDDSSGDFGPFAVDDGSELFAQKQAECGNHESDHPNGDGRRENADLQKREAHPDHKSIDAGCYGKQEQDFHHLDVEILLFTALFQGFDDHLDPDDGKNGKGNPVIDGCHRVVKRLSD